MTKHVVKFFLEPNKLWFSLMRPKYGTWVAFSTPLISYNSSFIWNTLYMHISTILSNVSWVIGDVDQARWCMICGYLLFISHKLGITNHELLMDLKVKDFLLVGEKTWNTTLSHHAFDEPLANKVPRCLHFMVGHRLSVEGWCPS